MFLRTCSREQKGFHVRKSTPPSDSRCIGIIGTTSAYRLRWTQSRHTCVQASGGSITIHTHMHVLDMPSHIAMVTYMLLKLSPGSGRRVMGSRSWGGGHLQRCCPALI
jgi:hypothetical protein